VLPQDIKQLRQELNCTARDLASALKVEQKDVLAWEAGELFPTKRHVLQMEALRSKGAGAVPRTVRTKPTGEKVGMQRLEDPKLWELIRKLLTHPKLFAQVEKLASTYSDPAHDLKQNDSER
jgi:transcriptional regulator with XRE-family HTH domain